MFTDFQPRNVDSSPTPTFTVPSPTGKTHPYPGRWLPLRSRRSRCLSIQGSSWYGLWQVAPHGHSQRVERSAPSARPNREFAPSATTR